MVVIDTNAMSLFYYCVQTSYWIVHSLVSPYNKPC
nr:MAG TPA: hypothetical protein [Caudoviricetes sp.]